MSDAQAGGAARSGGGLAGALACPGAGCDRRIHWKCEGDGGIDGELVMLDREGKSDLRQLSH
jgi:hypothetical protein